MLTMRPQPASSMSGSTAWVQWKTPLRLTSTTFDHSSSVMFVKRRNPERPAAFTRIVTGPNGADRGQGGVDLLPVGDVGEVAEVGVGFGEIDGRDMFAVGPEPVCDRTADTGRGDGVVERDQFVERPIQPRGVP